MDSPTPSPRKPILLLAALLVLGVLLLNYLADAMFSPEPVYTLQGPPPAYRAQSPDVVLFATAWCGYCKAAREYFQHNGIAYLNLDIEENAEAEAEHDALGARGVPLILIKDKLLHGWDQAKVTQTLITAGLLK